MTETQKSSTAGKKAITPVEPIEGKKPADPVADATTKEAKPTVKGAKPTTKTPAAKKVDKEELMKKHQQMVQFVQNVLSEMESDIKRMHMILNQLAKWDPENPETLEAVQKEME